MSCCPRKQRKKASFLQTRRMAQDSFSQRTISQTYKIQVGPCDGSFQILEKINYNAFKIDLPDKHQVNSTFNVSDLSPFYLELNSRASPFQEEGNDTIMDATFKDKCLQLMFSKSQRCFKVYCFKVSPISRQIKSKAHFRV